MFSAVTCYEEFSFAFLVKMIYLLAKQAMTEASDFQFVLERSGTGINDLIWTETAEKLFVACAKWKAKDKGPLIAASIASVLEMDDVNAAIETFKTTLWLNTDVLYGPNDRKAESYESVHTYGKRTFYGLAFVATTGSAEMLIGRLPKGEAERVSDRSLVVPDDLREKLAPGLS
ncbi:Hypothetical protein, putative [Bodo saltans]|uniref:Uncharacterized protein n=1 Tax=Bodo saltans TaxID=75058 RepID=A0A0S4JFN4_BODSA|nr:Hypothetical protein, putative [Bodo saltans]|eukprot:CUG89268.1 Hypothetical protein, putative [Bodo saltans]